MSGSPRQCGDCSLCCKVLAIPELDKPKDEWCPNFVAGNGCGIYAGRPASCRSFSCRWLVDPTIGPEWKPSLCKMVLDVKPGMFVVHVDPAATRPWRAEPYYATLRRLAAHGLEHGIVVIVMEKRHSTVILPDHEEHLGVLAPGARISVARMMTDNGPQWRSRIVAPHET